MSRISSQFEDELLVGKYKRNYSAKDAKKFREVRRARLIHDVCIHYAVLFQVM